MTYAVKQDLVDRFGTDELVQLTDRAGIGAIDDVKIGAVLADTDDLINAKLAARYALPLSSVPNILKRWACDIARWMLYDDGAPDGVKARYDDAIKQLDAVAKGTMELGLDAAAAEVAPPQQATVTSAERRGGRDNLDGY